MKYINFKKYKFNTVINYIKSSLYNFIAWLKHIIIKNFQHLDLKKFIFHTIIKNLDYRNYNFNKIYRNIRNRNYKLVSLYFLLFLFLTTFVYLIIPAFYNYDKLKIENIICKGINIKCAIKGDVYYSFYPTPRIIVKDLIIKDIANEKENIGKIDDVIIKISSKNLSKKEKLNFTNIEFKNGIFNINLNNLSKYRNLVNKNFNSKPIKINKTNIIFFDNNKQIANLKNIKFYYKTKNKKIKSTLKGEILNEDVIIKYNKVDKLNNFVVKFSKSKLISKIEIQDLVNKNDTVNGKVSFKKNKNQFTGTYSYNYKNKEIIFDQANLRNNFLDGKVTGSLYFSPFFDFDLDIDLNIINFNKLLNSIISLKKENKEELFRINRKINGKINLSSKKILSKYSLINSFESRLKFINGNILIDQMLLNLGKFGAADVNGVISNETKSSIFKFENNIFIDNKKYFFNKFGVFNKEKNPFNLFVSGIFDLKNLNFRLNEIFIEEKYAEQDMLYIEQQLNENLLSNGYESLFNFIKLKEFVKLINSEPN